MGPGILGSIQNMVSEPETMAAVIGWSQSPFGLDFGTFDLGLTIENKCQSVFFNFGPLGLENPFLAKIEIPVQLYKAKKTFVFFCLLYCIAFCCCMLFGIIV